MYERITEWLANHPIASGSLLAFVLAMLRMYGSNKSWKSQCVEACTCALISTGLTFLCTSIWHLDVNISIFLGSACGYFGTDNIRAFAHKFLNKKLNNDIEVNDED